MPTFEFIDGTTFEFEEFEPDTNSYTTCSLPPASTKRYAYNATAYIYQKKEDALLTKSGYNRGLTKPQQDQIRVGILKYATKHPYPQGLYIPYKLSQWGGATHCMDLLQGDFIVCKNIKEEEATAK